MTSFHIRALLAIPSPDATDSTRQSWKSQRKPQAFPFTKSRCTDMAENSDLQVQRMFASPAPRVRDDGRVKAALTRVGSADARFACAAPLRTGSADASFKREFSAGASFTRHRSADISPARTGSADAARQSSFGKRALASSNDTKPIPPSGSSGRVKRAASFSSSSSSFAKAERTASSSSHGSLSKEIDHDDDLCHAVSVILNSFLVALCIGLVGLVAYHSFVSAA
jgi:hypothetical protein